MSADCRHGQAACPCASACDCRPTEGAAPEVSADDIDDGHVSGAIVWPAYLLLAVCAVGACWCLSDVLP